jgi:hypothetical protein
VQAPQELAAAQPAPPTQPPVPSQPALIDDQAKRLAAFFNGEVVTLDGPLLELEPTPPDHQAACAQAEG